MRRIACSAKLFGLRYVSLQQENKSDLRNESIKHVLQFCPSLAAAARGTVGERPEFGIFSAVTPSRLLEADGKDAKCGFGFYLSYCAHFASNLASVESFENPEPIRRRFEMGEQPLVGSEVRPARKTRERTPQIYKVCDGVSEALIYCMAVFTPWAFGTTEEWSIWTMNVTGYALGL